MNNIIIYGGTFDPLHNGHLNTALAVQAQFHFERFIFLPCKTPLIKKAASASSEQRVHMLQLALQNIPEFSIDNREIIRDTPSYMVDTLKSFRKELGESISITLCLGMDAFIQLPKWHSWQEIISLSNLLILKRAEIKDDTIEASLENLLKNHEVFNKTYLLTQPHGAIYRIDAGSTPFLRLGCGNNFTKERILNPISPCQFTNILSPRLYIFSIQTHNIFFFI